MRTMLRMVLLVAVAAATACAPRERTLILLSTNDMHASIQQFPRLAAAVEACRDTAQLVVLVDAGDRWTGNAFVDRAPTPGMPMIELMNQLRYDVATLGNHEFDLGQAFLGRMIDSMDFEVICANVVSDTCTFPQLPPYTIIERDGIRIGFVGVVTNYEGPEIPAGNAASFVGITFPDPQQMAQKYAAELRPKCDLLVLVSHMGDERDLELVTKNSTYDLVIGGHTHKQINNRVGGTLLTQTGKNLQNIGVTVVKMRGRKVVHVDFRLVSLADYQPEESYAEQVHAYYADPELNRPVGEFLTSADKWGLANWMAGTIADQADAEVGFYHIGGVRLDSISKGGVSFARLFDLEPFGTQIARMRMTPAELRKMLLVKYNDPINAREAHRLDLISTTPYVIVTNAADSALDVRFPALQEGKVYDVAMNDYVYKNYNELHYTDGEITDELVVDALQDALLEDSPLRPDNTPRQTVVRSR